jgi:ABC-type amino acid transport substrate-binding protein
MSVLHRPLAGALIACVTRLSAAASAQIGRLNCSSNNDRQGLTLLREKIATAIADSPRPALLTKVFPGKVSSPLNKPLARYPAGFAVKGGDMDFVNFLNSWIAGVQADGWLERREAYWIQNREWMKGL